MSGDTERAGFEALTAGGAEDAAARSLAGKLKASPDPRYLKALAALWLHAASAAPERSVGLYDAAAEGWLGKPVAGPAIKLTQPAAEAIPAAFWASLWELVGETGRPEAGNLTNRTAALSGEVAPAIVARVARAAMGYPGVREAAARGIPQTFSLEALARCPADSLAGVLHRLVTEQGFELEPLDRGQLALDQLPPPLDYLNARILQCHDLWHIVAGYRTTALHEVAISAFQLAQFGHHYSAMFLGMALTRLAFEQPAGGPILLETILTAWAHGRATPSLLPVKWESVWDRPVDLVRSRLGVTPYASPFPADLFEQLSAPADAA